MRRVIKHVFSLVFLHFILDQHNTFVHPHPETPNFVFVTSSHADDFMHLENLIGSIHTYAPAHRLLLYDLGLTPFQRTILYNYLNVQIHTEIMYSPMALIRHASTLYERMMYIDAKSELIRYPSTIEQLLKRQSYFFLAEHCRHNGFICQLDNETLVSTDLIAVDGRSLFLSNETQWNNQVTLSVLVRSANLTVHAANSDIRRRKGEPISFPYIDLIRKRFRLAIVLPFISGQLDKVFQQLKTYEIYAPCRKKLSHPVDLLFYYHRWLNESLKKRIEDQIRPIQSIHRCFHQIQFISANLTAEEDVHPFGVNLMWQRILLESPEHKLGLSLRGRGYTHLFWMEPDTLPVRHHWLEALNTEITTDRSTNSSVLSNWWIRGSMYRGTSDIGHYLMHINGNALYHLSSTFFQYLQLVWELFPFDQDRTTAFDTNIFFYVIGMPDESPPRRRWKGSKIDRQNMGKRFWHKFIYSEFIQNCAYTGCMDDPIGDSPLTYFVHGGVTKISNSDGNLFVLRWEFVLVLLLMLSLCLFKRLASMRTIRINRLFSKTIRFRFLFVKI